jgi:hypothetical protein
MMQFDEPAANDVLLRAIPESERIDALCARASEVGSRLLAAAQKSGAIRRDLNDDDLFLLIWERGIIARACDQQSRDGYIRRMEFILHGLRAPGR